MTEPLKRLIMKKADGGELKQCAIAQGMQTLRQDGWRRVLEGKTTVEEVVRVTQTDEVMAETTGFAEPVVACGKAALESAFPSGLHGRSQKSPRHTRVNVKCVRRVAEIARTNK